MHKRSTPHTSCNLLMRRQLIASLLLQVEVARELGLSKDDAERKPRAKPKPKAKRDNSAAGGSGAGRKRRPASAAAASSGDDAEDGDWADAEYEAPKAKRRRRAKAAAPTPEAPREDPSCTLCRPDMQAAEGCCLVTDHRC